MFVFFVHVSDVQKALKGLVVMNSDLSSLFKQLFNGKLPSMWSASSYPSLKPVDAYINDLIARVSLFPTAKSFVFFCLPIKYIYIDGQILHLYVVLS